MAEHEVIEKLTLELKAALRELEMAREELRMERTLTARLEVTLKHALMEVREAREE